MPDEPRKAACGVFCIFFTLSMTLSSSNLKIALQKSGRLAEKSLEILAQIGLDFDRSKDQLFARCRNFDLDILFLRDDDIPEYVQDGVCDLGIAGENIIRERKARVKTIEKLGFGRCRLSLAVPEGSSAKNIKDLQGKRIATSYPESLGEYLRAQKMTAQTIPLRGSVEIAPSLNLSDAICDLVSTGNTLKQSGLKEIETLFESEAVLIQGKDRIPKGKGELINRLILRFQGLLQAKRSKYILMNAPEKALSKIKTIIPALSSPTVVPLTEPGMIAIHSVIEEEVFWDVIEKLKAAGASGILVVPIEKMIL